MIKPLLYLRSLLLVPILALHTLLCSFLILGMLILRFPRKWVDFAISRIWCTPLLVLAGIRVECQGCENVPLDKGFLFLFTHSSHFDIPVLFNCSPKGFRFGAKIELLSIPFFGQAAKLAGTLPIARQDRASVIEVYKQAESRVAAGESFALAPEGTRRKGAELQPFKSGPFIFARNTKSPVVPVILSGVEHVMPKGSLWINCDRWTRTVGVRFLPPLETKDIPEEKIKDFRDQVRAEMVEVFEEMKPKYT
ncbi:MAG: 1-acyl-sn-glycerol-3-phosphate acyltransferase [Bdellovibrionales bacterium]|nr:1-acyl-sn-glycerol-3-phosphate acyltransferase [Bdellovibrionales bacterium]